MKPWEQYQEDCATVFRKLGLNAVTNVTVKGVRAEHDVDVFVTGKIFGLEIKWVAECKDWKSNIPKEKAAALVFIVQDVGADKGILLSEVGFQPGALDCVRGTNVMLTSVAYLEKEIRQDGRISVLSALSWRLHQVNGRLGELIGYDKEFILSDSFQLLTGLTLLDWAFGYASRDEFPVMYALGARDEKLWASNFEELVDRAQQLLDGAEKHCETKEKQKGIAGGSTAAEEPKKKH